MPACVAACKTQKPRPRNDVGRSGVLGDEMSDPIGYDILYHECNADLVCPVGEATKEPDWSRSRPKQLG